MTQIVYWSLQNSKQSVLNGSVSLRRSRDKARKSLCKQMESLMMSQWNKNRHICENYSPFKNATECSGTLFYHWGALNGFVGMVEDGYWVKTPSFPSLPGQAVDFEEQRQSLLIRGLPFAQHEKALSAPSNDTHSIVTYSSCYSHTDCQNCSKTTACHWCSHDQRCHVMGSLFG